MSFNRCVATAFLVAVVSSTVQAGLFDNSVLSMLPVAANDVVYDSTRNLLYASVPATAGSPNANSIVTIDPVSRTIVHSVSVGSNPNRLAVSADGSRVYVGLDGSRAFTWWQPADNTVGPPVPLVGAVGTNRPAIVENFAISPLRSDVVVVSEDEVGNSASGDLEIFQNSTSLGRATPLYPFNNANEIGFSDNHTLFSYDNSDTSQQLATWNFDGTSLSRRSSQNGVYERDETHIVVRDGLVYENTGKVFDPATLTYVGFFSGAIFGGVDSDPTVGRTYFAGVGTSSLVIRACDNHTFLTMETKTFTGTPFSGTMSRFVLAGPNAWAFVTTKGQLGLISNVPEPATLTLLVAGLISCSRQRTRRNLGSPD